MKKSNKILLGLCLSLVIIYLPLIFWVKPEYKRFIVRDINDSYKVIQIDDSDLKTEKVLFSVAKTKEETYLYYGEGKSGDIVWFRGANDTLVIMKPQHVKAGTSLHLHLKGVDEVLLRNEVIYNREP